jgi:hypothetical protein
MTLCPLGYLTTPTHREHTTGTLSGPRGWSQDVSEAMACKVLELAERDDYELTEGTLAFVEAHSPRVVGHRLDVRS